MSLQIAVYTMARWQNGYAADCKSVDLGSTPGRASTELRLMVTMVTIKTTLCPSGGIGRHKGFKIPR